MSFTDREYEYALSMIEQMSNSLSLEIPCNKCFMEDNTWCKNHCHDISPDKECYRKYFGLLVKDDILKEMNHVNNNANIIPF